MGFATFIHTSEGRELEISAPEASVAASTRAVLAIPMRPSPMTLSKEITSWLSSETTGLDAQVLTVGGRGFPVFVWRQAGKDMEAFNLIGT